MKPGNVVVLNSGGPRMVVSVVLGDEVMCVWLNANRSKEQARFPIVCVKKVGGEN